MPALRSRDISLDDYPSDEEMVFTIPAGDISKLVNPLSSPPWFGVHSPITVEDIQQAIASGNVVTSLVGEGVSDYEEYEEDIEYAHLRQLHIGRIAAFVLTPPEDAICLGVGMPCLGIDMGDEITVDDGNHRLAAAIYLNADIPTTYTGEWEEFQRLFPEAELISDNQTYHAEQQKFP